MLRFPPDSPKQIGYSQEQTYYKIFLTTLLIDEVGLIVIIAMATHQTRK